MSCFLLSCFQPEFVSFMMDFTFERFQQIIAQKEKYPLAIPIKIWYKVCEFCLQISFLPEPNSDYRKDEILL